MDSVELETKVNELLNSESFAQPEFEQSLGSIFSKDNLAMAVGTSASVQIGNIVGNMIPIGQLPAGTSAILAGVLGKKFMGKGIIGKVFDGVIQGGIATALTPITNSLTGMLPSYGQEVKEEVKPKFEGVMW